MKDLICNQREIPRKKWRYGLRSSAAVGCGWIATYNALRILGRTVNIEELIRYYERQLPLIHGNAGTSFWGPGVLFGQWGFPTRWSFRREEFDSLAREADVCILFYRWQSKWKFGAHFVALHHTERGFVGYNTYRNSRGEDLYGPSLTRFLKTRNYWGCCLVAIQNKED